MQDFGFRPPSPPPVPKKKHLQLPQPKREHVEKATSPIALRYWNQCLNAGEPTGPIVPTNNASEQESIMDLPWISKEDTPSKTPSPNPASMKPTISVPDIRRHMKEVRSNTNWEEILREQEQFEAVKHQTPAFYKQRKVKQTFSSVEKSAYIGSGQNSSSSWQTNSIKTFTQEENKKSAYSDIQNNNNSQLSPSNKLLAAPRPHNHGPTPPIPQRDHDDPSPVIERKGIQYERILSTAGQGIKRENERQEAKLNINRFITIGQLKTPNNLHINKPKDPNDLNNEPKQASTHTNTTQPTNKNDIKINTLLSEKQFLMKQSQVEKIPCNDIASVKMEQTADTSSSSSFNSSDSDSDLDRPTEASNTKSLHSTEKTAPSDQGLHSSPSSKLPSDARAINKAEIVLSYLKETDPKHIQSSILQNLDEMRKNSLGNSTLIEYFVAPIRVPPTGLPLPRH